MLSGNFCLSNNVLQTCSPASVAFPLQLPATLLPDMNLSFNWINILILFGALQALIFSIVLLFQRKHPGAPFLAAFVFVIAYNGFETFNWSSGLDQHYLFFDLFSFIIIYAIGPSLYLYVRMLLDPQQKVSVRQILLHYGLVLFQFFTRVAIIVYHLLWINKIIDTDMHPMELVNIVWFYAEPLSVAAFLAYFIAALVRFRQYTKFNNAKLHVKERHLIVKWLRALLIVMSVFAIAWPLTVLAPEVFNAPFGPHYYPIELALVLFSYWIVFYGFYNVRLISYKTNSYAPQANDSNLALHLNRLKKAMEEEKLYLDPELNVAKLASHLGVPSKTISAVLNQHHNTGFNDFINAYRVREVSARLIDPANQQFTISGIALDSGFNSHATFQRVFKNATGMSPREYMNLHLKKTG
jgi:AraC-like DNA-binding protein